MDLVAGDLGAVGSHEGHVRQLPGLLQALRTNPPPDSVRLWGTPRVTLVTSRVTLVTSRTLRTRA